ncbi:MAG: hypothetical protein DRJ37_00740 [Thermoprotei archaeon]|nr:MAG: hypothetical protein DRJ37_00740 [Thermoprotei archaeon]
MEFYRIANCIDYEENLVAKPVIEVTLINPLTSYKATYRIPIDTGFAGYIMVTHEIYQKFSSLELPPTSFLTYTTVIGRVTLKRSRVIAKIFNRKIETFIETPILWPGKLLLGRRILNQIDLAMLGTKLKLCLLAEKETNLTKLEER